MKGAVGIEAQVLYKALEDCFEPWRYTDVFPKKGVQFHNSDRIRRVYLSTFASVPVLRRILDRNTPDSLLFTHHPVPPKPDEDGNYGIIPEEILTEMAQKGLSLFSYHIPMDCHRVYSPARTLAKAMGMEPYEVFYPQNGGHIGVLCNAGCDKLDVLAGKLESLIGHRACLYRYGGDLLESGRAAVMPGGAKSVEIYRFLRESGINTFITGVTNEKISWVRAIHEEARRWGVTLIGGTHYSTEMFAPMAMAEFFARFGLESEYIADQPNLLDM